MTYEPTEGTCDEGLPMPGKPDTITRCGKPAKWRTKTGCVCDEHKAREETASRLWEERQEKARRAR